MQSTIPINQRLQCSPEERSNFPQFTQGLCLIQQGIVECDRYTHESSRTCIDLCAN
jgi:hypothetical protein